MKRLVILFSFLPFIGVSQVNTPTWGIEDTIMVISKTTDYGPVHDYLELFNNSGQALDMRWVCQEPSSWPPLWITNFTDPTANYDDVGNLDSADFIIPFPIEWSNKLIIGVQHYSYAHTDTVAFDVWPLSAPQDKLRLYYVIIIAQGNAWAGMGEESTVEYYYNSASKLLKLKSNSQISAVEVYNMAGQLLLTKEGNALEAIGLEDVKDDMIIVKTVSEIGEEQSFKVVLH